jgi:hypothetical protein
MSPMMRLAVASPDRGAAPSRRGELAREHAPLRSALTAARRRRRDSLAAQRFPKP